MLATRKGSFDRLVTPRRPGDWGRELALYLRHELGGTAAGAGSRNLMTVSVAISRFRGQLSGQKAGA